MQGALIGFSTIWLVVAVGWVSARIGLVTHAGQHLLASLSFLVASPALLFGLVAKTPLDRFVSLTVLSSAVAIVVSGFTYLVVAKLLFKSSASAATVGFMSAIYINSGNLGLPIAAHLLGDAARMAPILLIQVAIIQPACLAVLDGSRFASLGRWKRLVRYATMPVRNPITVGILLGLLVNVCHVPVPELLMEPILMVGRMAVPMMLISLGCSLYLDPRPGSGDHAHELIVVQLIKVLWQPLVAFLVARFGFRLDAHEVFVVTVIAALPTAQSVFVIAERYRTSEALARDSVFWSTILSVATVLAITAAIAA